MAQALAEGKLKPDSLFERYFEHCLLCQTCEKVCPSKVSYRVIFEQAQQLSQQHKNKSLPFFARLLTNKKRLSYVHTILRILQRTKIIALIRKLRISHLFRFENALKMLPILQKNNLNGYYFVTKEQTKTVAIFTGCLASHWQQQTLQSLIQLLTAAGFNVVIPETQSCCGSLQSKYGDNKTVSNLLAQNLHAFSDKDIMNIIYINSACGAKLQDNVSAGTQQDDSKKFVSDRLSEATLWLEKNITLKQIVQPNTLKIETINNLENGDIQKNTTEPRPLKIAWLAPCTHHNNIGHDDVVERIFSNINFIEIIRIPLQNCCGAAGDHFLKQSDFAEQLRQPILDFIAKQQFSAVITTNIGCHRFIEAGLREQENNIPVLHPIDLIAKYFTANKT